MAESETNRNSDAPGDKVQTQGIVLPVNDAEFSDDAPTVISKSKPLTPPPTLNWEVWNGPADPMPYSPLLHPEKGRGFWNYGNGMLGDWAGKEGVPVVLDAAEEGLRRAIDED